MKLFRSVLFWTHLTAGVVAGVVILIMSFTGAVLALKPQILNYIERDVRFVTPDGSPRLSAARIMAAVRTAQPESSPSSLTLNADPTMAAAVNVGAGGNVYVNPYSGAVLGKGSERANAFFQSMTSWHRYVNATGESRNTGRAFTGWSNLAFLVLGVTGLYIWWPKQLTVRHFKAILWFRGTSTARARDFNWHNVIGFWCLPAIIIMTVSGAVISFPWANNLVYQLTGSPIPAGRGAGPGQQNAAAAPAGRGEGRGRGGRPEGGERSARPEGERTARVEGAGASEARGDRPRNGGERGEGARGAQAGAGESAATVIPANLDQIWVRAEQQVPTWSVLTARMPNREGGSVAFTITDGAHWNQFARSNLTLDGTTGEVAQWQPYAANSLGQKARGWLRFAHTGELGGLIGQIIAGIGCLGGVMLVYTGLSLAFRRLWNWSLWARLRGGSRQPAGVTVSAPLQAPDVAAGIRRDRVME